jgi:phosphoribosylanthranilate isomerase
MVKVKICGITRWEDAQAAVAAGADALGFVFARNSPRFIPREAAAAIIRRLPPFIATVGVFVDMPLEELLDHIACCGLDTAQLHGGESPDFCGRIAVKTIKAFRIQDETSLVPLPRFETSAWLLDSYVPGQLGGTGATFRWPLAVQAVAMGRPVILAGGLTPENIAEAVKSVRPYGVDVSSGVESAPGRKDREKMRAFLAAAKTA